MAAEVESMALEWRRAAAVAAAYAGTDAACAAVEPAVRMLRRALPDTKLLLLWPQDVDVPAAVSALADAALRYPAEGCADGDVASIVDAVRAESPFGVVVFTEPHRSAATPAYIAYLAGIERRVGIAAEFAGRLLTHPVSPPRAPLRDEERHVFLLHAAGIVHATPSADAAFGTGTATTAALASWSR